MNIAKIDLNLLVYLDVLLRERNVTKAASQLGITQPAMSNSLKRLRDIFKDPLLVRTSNGMTPTQRAIEVHPTIRDVLTKLEETIQTKTQFCPLSSNRTFRVMASDYAESTLLTRVIMQLSTHAPNVSLDLITPSDVTFYDVEQGKVDMAINRFEELPQSFHQKVIWHDEFACVINKRYLDVQTFDLETYLAAKHIWVSKTGFGVGVGIDPNQIQKLGWVDAELTKQGKQREIKVFTRHYHVALQLAKQQNLVATLPRRVAELYQGEQDLHIINPPFAIPKFPLKMAWSALLQHDPGHIWFRRLISQVAIEEAI